MFVASVYPLLILVISTSTHFVRSAMDSGIILRDEEKDERGY